MRRQRSLQKGKSGSALLTDFLQIGQRSLTVRLRGIRFELRQTAVTESLLPDRSRALQ